MPKTKHKTEPTAEAIVLSAPQPIVAAPTIQQTILRIEQARKFIAKAMNRELQHALKKLPPGKTLSDKQRAELEVDYGSIPGIKKPFLKQPGGEKLCLWMNVRPVYETQATELGDGHLEVVSRVRLLSKATSEEVFSGPTCSCSTMEPNYRYKWVTADPQPSKDWIFKDGKVAKAEGRGKSVPEWKNGVKTGVWLWQDRYENKDIHGERNKIRQMAEKRALVKAVRNYGAFSEIFTESPDEWELTPDEEAEAEQPPTGRVVKSSPPGEGSGVTQGVPTPQPPATSAPSSPSKGNGGGGGPSGGPEVAPAGPAPIISIEWKSDAAEVGYVSGDLTRILPYLIRNLQGIKLEDKDVWVVPANMVPELEQWCRDNDHGFQEVSGMSSSGSPKTEKPQEVAVPSQATPTQGPGLGQPGPAAISGLVKLVKPTKNKKSGVENYNVLIGEEGSGQGIFYYCYRKDLWALFDKALNKQVTVWVKDKAIVGFVKLNGRTFCEDGITPEIQNAEDRKPTGSLFT